MSYDVSFAIKEKHTGELFVLDNFISNITWNVKELIKQSSGWEIKNEQENGLVKDLIPKLHEGRMNLTMFSEQYKQYESPNGWGTIRGVKRFYSDIIREWEKIETDEYHNLYKFRDYLYIYID